jgi:hypothetical protein
LDTRVSRELFSQQPNVWVPLALPAHPLSPSLAVHLGQRICLDLQSPTARARQEEHWQSQWHPVRIKKLAAPLLARPRVEGGTVARAAH